MFSPHDSPAVNDWFRRFDAASRRLPAEERTAQREEIRQHLEGLAAAKVAQGQPAEVAWKSALTQFGDPTQIGRKMYQEWQQGRTGFRADIRAVFFGIGLAWLQNLIAPLYLLAWQFLRDSHVRANFDGSAHPFPVAVCQSLAFGGTLLVCLAIGRKYPLQAIKGAFYSSLLWSLIGFLEIVAMEVFNPRMTLSQPVLYMILRSQLWLPLWELGHSLIAYLASVTKRGWYKPSLADFKLNLPRRRPQISR